MGGSNNGFSNNIYAVLAPDRIEKRQNGRRIKEDGEPMFTLTAQDRHGVMMTRHEIIKETDISHCLMARDYKGFGNQEMTGVLYVKNANNIGGIYTNDSKDFHSGTLEGLSRTLKSNNHDAGVTDGFRIRKLTPLECWRLQGFTDEQFYKAKKDGVSNSQLYKQAGNSVTVNVIDAIARKFT